MDADAARRRGQEGVCRVQHLRIDFFYIYILKTGLGVLPGFSVWSFARAYELLLPRPENTTALFYVKIAGLLGFECSISKVSEMVGKEGGQGEEPEGDIVISDRRSKRHSTKEQLVLHLFGPIPSIFHVFRG